MEEQLNTLQQQRAQALLLFYKATQEVDQATAVIKNTDAQISALLTAQKRAEVNQTDECPQNP